MADELRVMANQAMARAFEEADLIVAATKPGPAFPAEWATSNQQGPVADWFFGEGPGRYAVRGLLGAVRAVAGLFPKVPSALLGAAEARLPELVTDGRADDHLEHLRQPRVSIPAGTLDGLPVGMQVLAPHHHDELLFEVALAAERHRPWPLVAPPSPPESRPPSRA